MTLKWNGDKLIKIRAIAVANALNFIASESVIHAINNHSGWQYRTGIAEGSIRVKDFATIKKQFVLWGSIWTGKGSKVGSTVTDTLTGKEVVVPANNYVWFLEFSHGAFLRNAADSRYKGLASVIKRNMRAKKIKIERFKKK